MSRIDTLKAKVDALYGAKSPNREIEWADYLYIKHVFVVADKAGQLADRFGAQKDLAMAAGMLHDVADAVMPRKDPRHEQESMDIARRLLAKSGFTDDEIKIVVDDIIRFHSCRDGKVPQSLEGKVMATADALGHLQTDFYDFAVKNFMERGEKVEEIREWGLEKTDRDFNKKIFFPEVQQETQADFERLQERFRTLK